MDKISEMFDYVFIPYDVVKIKNIVSVTRVVGNRQDMIWVYDVIDWRGKICDSRNGRVQNLVGYEHRFR